MNPQALKRTLISLTDMHMHTHTHFLFIKGSDFLKYLVATDWILIAFLFITSYHSVIKQSIGIYNTHDLIRLRILLLCVQSVSVFLCVSPSQKRKHVCGSHRFHFPFVVLITLFCLFWKGIELEIVNICEENNGGCSHHCEPAIGGAHCSCNDGHQLDTDGKTCIGNVCQAPSSCKVSLDSFNISMLKHIATSGATPLRLRGAFTVTLTTDTEESKQILGYLP